MSKLNTKKSYRGFFLTFEGPECAGKTTHIRMLKEHFQKKGAEILVTREPGGTEIGEELRDIVKHHIGESAVVDEAELLLFAASRAQLVRKVILPALEKGVNVICDRFADSTTAYQGYARGIDLDFIAKLNAFATCGCFPDLTIILDLDPEKSLERRLKRDETLLLEDRIESEELGFHRKVRNGFLKIAAMEPNRVKVINTDQPAEIVHRQILELIENATGQF